MKQVHAQITCIMNIIVLFNTSQRKSLTVDALPVLFLAPISSKVFNYHLYVNSSLLLLFLTSSLKFQDHGFPYLTFNTSPFGCFTTPHISVNLSHLRGIYSQKLSTSTVSLLPPHPCFHYFLASFPISNIQL